MKKKAGTRILLIVLGAIIIFAAVRSFALSKEGVVTTATVTDVSFSEERDRNDEWQGTVTQKYTFTVDGKDYIGANTYKFDESDRFRNDGLYVQMFIQEKEKESTVRVKYLPSNPNINASAESASDDPKAAIFRGLGILVGILMILYGILLKRKKKQNKTQVKANTAANFQQPLAQPYPQPDNSIYPYPQGNYSQNYSQQSNFGQNAVPNNNNGISSSGRQFCPNCGAQVGDANFCEHCGTRLR